MCGRPSFLCVALSDLKKMRFRAQNARVGFFYMCIALSDLKNYNLDHKMCGHTFGLGGRGMGEETIPLLSRL